MAKSKTKSSKVNVGINESQRKEIAQGLAILLADTYTLYLKTHNFHWNVTGPMFSILHGLFEKQYSEMQEAVDEIAERIRSLGSIAPGSYREFSQLTSVKEGDGHTPSREMIAQLLESHESLSRSIRGLFASADKGQDEATKDLLTGRLEFHEKTAWMLRSHLEGS